MVIFIVAAGEAFCRSAVLQMQLGSKHQAATEYVNAGTCYKKADPNGRHKKLSSTLDNLICSVCALTMKNIFVKEIYMSFLNYIAAKL